MDKAQFIDVVSKNIISHHLLLRGKKVLVAFSGGADSTALLLVLHNLGYEVEAVHCNFHLRGDESDRDETFCRDFCERMGIVFHIAHFATMDYAEFHKMSIEMAARELRYAYFRQLINDIDAQGICVAHHKDDNVETVLLNLIRGTGIHGLTGMKMKNGNIIRPFLCVGRQDIEDYLKAVGEDYVTDSTNLVDDVKRNKLRLDVIPILKSINPSVTDCISDMAKHMEHVASVFDKAIEQSAMNVSRVEDEGNVLFIDISKLGKEISSEHTLFYLLRPKGFSPSQIEQIYLKMNAPTGREWRSHTHQLLIDRGKMVVEPVDSNMFKAMRIPEEGRYVLDGHVLTVKLSCVGSNYKPARERCKACLDASKVAFPLTLRTLRQGDWFVPFGMKGRKLISDYLTDRKFSLFEKRRQLVLCDSEDKVVWLVCERPDERFKITSATSNAIEIAFEKRQAFMMHS